MDKINEVCMHFLWSGKAVGIKKLVMLNWTMFALIKKLEALDLGM